DRWRWVQRGIELLRDEALVYNPDDAGIYGELSRHFFHKMGQDLNDAQKYYKVQWFKEMSAVLGTNYVELINPQTEDARHRAEILRTKYKMDPRKMKQVDDQYGPLEWRLPEAHGIYWAAVGMEKAKDKDLIALRRLIFQAAQLAFLRGHLIVGKSNGQMIL